MRIAFVAPTFNEAENLPALAEGVLGIGPDVHMVCVDDASPDGTGAIADALAEADDRFHVIHRAGPRGYSASCKDGLTWCLDRDFDLVGTMDADLSHDPARITALVTAALSGADLVIGSRYVEGGGLVVDWGVVRRAVSQAGSAFARAMLGTPVRDCTSGFRLYRAEKLVEAPLSEIRSEGYSFQIELLAMLVDAGARVTEVPITYIDRRAGASKISGPIVWEALARTVGMGVSRLAGPRRRRRAAGSARRGE